MCRRYTHEFVIIIHYNRGPFRTQYTQNVFLIRQLPTLPTPLYTNLNFNYCLGANLRNYIDYINVFKNRWNVDWHGSYIDYINVFKNRWNVDWHGSYDCGRPHSACVRTYAVKITKLSPDVGPYKFTHTHTHTYTYEVVFGESEIWQGNWGHEFYPTFTVCIHTMSPETLQ